MNIEILFISCCFSFLFVLFIYFIYSGIQHIKGAFSKRYKEKIKNAEFECQRVSAVHIKQIGGSVPAKSVVGQHHLTGLISLNLYKYVYKNKTYKYREWFEIQYIPKTITLFFLKSPRKVRKSAQAAIEDSKISWTTIYLIVTVLMYFLMQNSN